MARELIRVNICGQGLQSCQVPGVLVEKVRNERQLKTLKIQRGQDASFLSVSYFKVFQTPDSAQFRLVALRLCRNCASTVKSFLAT